MDEQPDTNFTTSSKADSAAADPKLEANGATATHVASAARSISKDSLRHPIALQFFFWGEFAERCSY